MSSNPDIQIINHGFLIQINSDGYIEIRGKADNQTPDGFVHSDKLRRQPASIKEAAKVIDQLLARQFELEWAIEKLIDNLLLNQQVASEFNDAYCAQVVKDKERRLAGTRANKSKAQKTRAIANHAYNRAKQKLGNIKKQIVLDSAYELFLKEVNGSPDDFKHWSRRYFEQQVTTPT